MKPKKEIKKIKAKIRKLEHKLEPQVKQIGFDYLYNHHDDNEFE